MKFSMKSETGMSFVCEKPDETMKAVFAQKLASAVHEEIASFCAEVQSELRRLKPGEKMTLKSRPIEVTIERPLITGETAKEDK